MSDNKNIFRDIDLAILQRQTEQAEQELARLKTRGATPALLVREGQVRHLRGDGRGALLCFNSALSLDPGLAVAYRGMASLYADAGKLDVAMRSITKSLSIDSACPAAWHTAGLLYARRGDIAEASECFAKADEICPGYTIHVEARVHCSLLLGRYAQAEALCRAFSGEFTDKLHFHFADALYFQEKFLEAYEQYALVTASPFGDRAVIRMAHCLVQQGALSDAVACINAAIEQGSSELAELMRLRASIHVFEGERESAVALLQEVVARFPGHVYAWLTLFETSPRLAATFDTAALESLYAGSDENTRRAAAFALAIAAEEKGDLAGQMRYLEEGNRLAALRFPYAASAARREFETTRQVYSAPVLTGHLHTAQSFRPVFVLGLPRSGTTLTEQIISSHSRVQSTGESTALSEVFRRFGWKAILTERTPAIVDDARNVYRSCQLVDDHSKTHYVDKNISLYRYVGLLREMFPDAVFVALNRHPLDLMLGAWKRLFMLGNGFTYSISGLAHEIRLYQDYIDHWSGVTGIDIMRIQYEELVSRPDIWIPQIAEHCGLEWQDRMMSPAGNERTVMTASAAQVRQEIHKEAIDRWRCYGDLLEPFVRALRHEDVVIPGYDA